MLTRFVRIQLAIFTIVGTIGVIAMVLFYIQAPTLLGIGRMTVTLELPATGGLYRFSNVTYRGVQIGKVTAVALDPDRRESDAVAWHFTEGPGGPDSGGAQCLRGGRTVRGLAAQNRFAALPARRFGHRRARHDDSAAGRADARSGQCLGQQHPEDQTRPIARRVLPRLQRCRLRPGVADRFLRDESPRDANGVVDRTRALTEDTGPLLDSQAQTTDSIRTWARSFAGISDVLVNDDSQFRTMLQNGPGAANEASRLLDQIKPTLPVLLANLTTIGQIGVTYHPSLEQLLVLLPSSVAIEQAARRANHPDGWPRATSHSRSTIRLFARSASCHPAHGDPRPTLSRHRHTGRVVLQTAAGFTARGSRRPQLSLHGSPRKARAHRRNLQQRQAVHAAGDAPARPRSLSHWIRTCSSQGVPPDDRVTANDRIFGPVEGTPLPPGAVPRGTPPGPRGENPPPGTPGAAAPPVPSSGPPCGAMSQCRLTFRR